MKGNRNEARNHTLSHGCNSYHDNRNPDIVNIFSLTLGFLMICILNKWFLNG